MTISNYSISLNSVQVFFGFVESCGYVPHSVKYTAYVLNSWRVIQNSKIVFKISVCLGK